MNIIFHYPLPLNPNATSASGIRPLKMLKAFESLGYHVDVVSGYSKERRDSIANVQNKVKSGAKYAFMYSESSTMPTILTDPHHLPLNPLLDFNFFRFCKENGINTGLFYRDIYWRFPEYKTNLNYFKARAALMAYKWELYFYKLYLDKLYLPSLDMGNYIPIIQPHKFSTLPPGHDVLQKRVVHKNKSNHYDKIKIFYVGGMIGYDMHPLLSAVNKRNDYELIICTRKNEWDAVKNTYPTLNNNITIIHKIGDEMTSVMEESDLVSVYIKPEEYRDFAVPFKLFEYIGQRKPIIASQGTLAGQFVTDNKIGWTIPYDEYELHKLLDQIVQNPELIKETSIIMDGVAQENTWMARAEKVARDLEC